MRGEIAALLALCAAAARTAELSAGYSYFKTAYAQQEGKIKAAAMTLAV